MNGALLTTADKTAIAAFESARGEGLVVVEGLHALKHALRFGAEIKIACSFDIAKVMRLASSLCPDQEHRLLELLQPVTRETFLRLTPRPHETAVVALAKKPVIDPMALLAPPRRAPLILLDQPRHLGNLGAVIRVAAASGAAGVLVLGDLDPWHGRAVRGSAGLHFALPVGKFSELPDHAGPLIGIDPGGEPFGAARLPDDALLVFGGERAGIGKAVRASSERCLAIPMAPGVSSLNLATAVAVVLYGWRMQRPELV